jgi:hypothetical protein
VIERKKKPPAAFEGIEKIAGGKIASGGRCD